MGRMVPTGQMGVKGNPRKELKVWLLSELPGIQELTRDVGAARAALNIAMLEDAAAGADAEVKSDLDTKPEPQPEDTADNKS